MQASEQVSEKRMTSRLCTYWEKLKKDCKIPDIHRFNSEALPEVWPQCFMVSVMDGDPIMYKVEYVGDIVVQMFGKSLQGNMLSASIKSIPGATVIGDIDECVRAVDVVKRHGTFVNDKSKIVKYRSCMLPFGAEGGEVSHVVIGLSWKSF